MPAAAARIAFNDLRSDLAEHEADYTGALRRVLESGRFVLGSEVRAFEREFASFCEVEHGVGVGSGTDALALLLRALHLGPGDEVIVPALTFVATAEAVVHVGATPVFADVNRETGLLTVEDIEAVASPRTRAVIPVHLYGLLCNVSEIARWADPRGVSLIEDAAQAHGARLDGRPVGSFGIGGAFSFYPGKNLGAFGDGGAVITGDAEVSRQVRALRDHGRLSKFEHKAVGFCSRLDELQASVLRVKLRRLAEKNLVRRHLAHRYRDELSGSTQIVGEVAFGRGDPAHHIVAVIVEDRRTVIEALRAAGIGFGVHYPQIVPEYEAFGSQHPGTWPNASYLASHVLSLPFHPYLSEDDLERVALTLKQLAGDG